MAEPRQKRRDDSSTARSIATVSADLGDGKLAELLYDQVKNETSLALWDGTSWQIKKEIEVVGERLVPYRATNNLIRHGVVLLPSIPDEYGDEATLTEEVRTFIHRYSDVSPLFEEIATNYVLFTWVYDRFNELPYLRVQGEPGCGKTRFLLTIGSLCYKPIFASGASTVSPLFRILDAFRGTVIIDESDFRVSDERTEVVKILNNGNVRGFPVLRSEAISGGKEFDPRAYHVFGPKLVASRNLFDDRGLESRFLTEDLGRGRPRPDIPINLPSSYRDEALQLRNKLLLFRFRNHASKGIRPELVDSSIEPRLNQIFVPLLSVVADGKALSDLRGLARSYHQQMIDDRGMEVHAQLLEVVVDLWRDGLASIPLRLIAERFAYLHGADQDRPVTARWIGSLLRSRLHLRTTKSHGVFVVPSTEYPKLEDLCERYAVERRHSPDQRPHIHPTVDDMAVLSDDDGISDVHPDVL
jgi:hypothetical protein